MKRLGKTGSMPLASILRIWMKSIKTFLPNSIGAARSKKREEQHEEATTFFAPRLTQRMIWIPFIGIFLQACICPTENRRIL